MRVIPTTVKNKELVKKRRQQIIMAAINLFSKNGYHKTTLKELAEEAGLSHGNVYDYVGSKEDIFFLIHDFIAGSAIEILNRSVENVQDPIDKLRRMVRAEFNLMDQSADALLLIYQETHILKGDFLRRLLEKERVHLEKFEVVIRECIEQGKFKDCDVRLVANLIKSMIDTLTIKRWDLRGHTSPIEAERMILKLVFTGLLEDKQNIGLITETSESLVGKTALVVNGGTVLVQAACSILLAQGLKLIVHVDNRQGLWKHSKNSESKFSHLPVCTLEQQDPLSLNQLQNIEKEYGPIDIYVHDLGIGTTDKPEDKPTDEPADKPIGEPTEKTLAMQVFNPFEKNMQSAHELGTYFMSKMPAKGTGRIVHIAPWGWDKYTDPIRFATTKAEAKALSHAMSEQMAGSGVNVNCIVPGYIRALRPQNIEKKLAKGLAEKIPSRRLGEVFDVTAAILFFIGDGAKYTTGQVFNVTGGLD
jgi:NAD(P)-dependent dehydrogenase (short-subunit alcohol dehydrogenase family)/AcrR family transcriptional regulator